jgi:hypothetical protein
MPISHEINPLAALDFQLRKGIADAYDLRRPDLQSSIVLISAHFNAICHDVDLPPLGWGIASWLSVVARTGFEAAAFGL